MSTARPAPRRLVALLIVTSIALLVADRHDPTIFGSARRSTLVATEPVRVGLDAAAGPAIGAWEGARGYDSWEEENERLRYRIDELIGERRQGTVAEAELRRLLVATDIDYVGDIDRVTARVVVDRRTGAGRVIEIDKGTDDGLGVGMPVVTGLGLVGTIELATADRAVVRPITDPEARVGVRSSVEYGIASGSGPGDPLALRLDARSDGAVDAEASFVTSGLNRSLYPDNIPVGRMTRPEGAGDGAAVLVPFADLDRLGYVSVLLWWAP